MKNKSKNSGFTLVELVVAIAVLGIITAISLPTINNIQTNSQEKKYTTYKNSILSSVKLYVDAYEEDEFDKNSSVSQCKAIKYDDLKNHNLLKEYDISGVKCQGQNVGSDENIAAYVYKGTNGKYEYYPMIYCSNKDDETVYGSKTVEVPKSCEMSSNDVSIVSDDLCFSSKEPKITLNVNSEKVNEEISRIDYAFVDSSDKNKESVIKNAIYGNLYTAGGLANNTEVVLPVPEDGEINKYVLALKYVYNSRDDEYKVLNPTIEVNYEEPKITVIAKKWNDNSISVTSSNYKSKAKDTYKSGYWSNKNIYLSATAKDGCGNNVNVKIDDKDEKYINVVKETSERKVEFKVEYGKESNVIKKVTVKLDKTPPTVPTVTLKKWSDNSTAPTNNTYSSLTGYSSEAWSAKNIYTRASSEDSISGVKGYYYTTTGATTNSTNASGTARNIKANGTSYIKYKACDNAGNCSNYSSNYTVKVDKIAPTCASSGGGTSWTNKDVTLRGTCTDNEGGSGCKNTSVSKKITEEMNSTAQTPGTIYDNAGNSTKCPNQTVKIDKTPPAVPTVTLKKWSDNSTAPTNNTYSSLTGYSSGTWSAKNIYTRASSEDSGGSGVNGYYYTTTGATTNSTNTNSQTRNIQASGTSYIKYKACDNAGNCSNYSSNYTVKVDKIAPTIKVTAYKKYENDTFSGKVLDTTTNSNISAGSYSNNTNNWLNKKNYPNGIYYKIESSDSLSKAVSAVWKYNKDGLTEAAALDDSTRTSSTRKSSSYSSYIDTGVKVQKDGYRIMSYTVTDAAGNSRTVNIIAALDRVAPTFTLVKASLSDNCKSEGCAYAACLKVSADVSLTKKSLQDINSSCPNQTTYTGYTAEYVYKYPNTTANTYGEFSLFPADGKGVYLGYRGYEGKYDSQTEIKVKDKAGNTATKEFKLTTNSDHSLKKIE